MLLTSKQRHQRKPQIETEDHVTPLLPEHRVGSAQWEQKGAWYLLESLEAPEQCEGRRHKSPQELAFSNGFTGNKHHKRALGEGSMRTMCESM